MLLPIYRFQRIVKWKIYNITFRIFISLPIFVIFSVIRCYTRFFGMAKNKNVILNKHTFNRSVRWLARILGYCFSIWANVCLCSLPVQSNLDGRLQSLLRVASSSSAASGHPPCLRYCNKISFYENWCHYLISTNKWTHKQTVGWTDGQTNFCRTTYGCPKGHTNDGKALNKFF